VFVNRVNFDDRVAAALEDGLDLAADRARCVLLGAEGRRAQTNECEEAGEIGGAPAAKKRARLSVKN
jgi:hypothetical protein